MSEPKFIGWRGEYECGCVGPIVRFKNRVLEYCQTHGDNRRSIFSEYEPEEPETPPVKESMTVQKL